MPYLSNSLLQNKLRFLLVGLFISIPCFLVFLNFSVYGSSTNINIQGKLTDDDGTNVSASCVGTNTCDFRLTVYESVDSICTTGDTQVSLETFTDHTLADGIFNFVLGTGTGSSIPSYDFGSAYTCVRIEFDDDGIDSDYEEDFGVTDFTAVPYSFNSERLNGMTSDEFVQLVPDSAQTLGTDTATGSLIHINENDANNSPNFIELENAGTDVFVLNNSGDLTIWGDIFPGTSPSYNLGSDTLRWDDIFVGPATLHIGTDTTDEGVIGYDTTGDVFGISTAGASADIALSTDLLYIDKSASAIGIGTTIPNASSRLEVRNNALQSETVRFTTNDFDSMGGFGSYLSMGFGKVSGSTYSNLQAYKYGGSTVSDIVMSAGGGNVGIGTSDTGAKLTVLGSISGGSGAKVAAGSDNSFVFGNALPEALPGSSETSGIFGAVTTGTTPAEVYSVEVQSDGKILYGGTFREFNGVSAGRIARVLASNGELDEEFMTNIGLGFNSTVRDIEVLSDGKILVVGAFTSFNGNTANRIARLNSDGTYDSAFSGLGVNNYIVHVEIVDDEGVDKILIGGVFTTVQGNTRNRIARLDYDGIVDTSFDAGTTFNDSITNVINDFEIDSSDRVIVGGKFASCGGNTNCNRIARISFDGVFDNTFDYSGGGGNDVWDIEILPSGQILVGGFFTTYNGTAVGRIVRLDADGTLEHTLLGGANNYVKDIEVNSDDSIYVLGQFATFGGVSRMKVVKLNDVSTSTPVVDTGFVPINGSEHTALSQETSEMAVQQDGKLLIVGRDGYFFEDYRKNSIGRLLSTGAVDTSFAPQSGPNDLVYVIEYQPDDGKILIGGVFNRYNDLPYNKIARLNADGSLDTGFEIGTGFNGRVESIEIQTNGKILVGGRISSFNGNSTASLVRLNNDGSYYNSIGTWTWLLDRDLFHITQTPLGKIVVSGRFASYNGNVNADNFVQINSDGTIDFPVSTDSYVYDHLVLSDGSIIIVGNFTTVNGVTKNRIAKINADGTLDNTFYSPAVNPNNEILTIEPDPGTTYAYIGGTFTSFDGVPTYRITKIDVNTGVVVSGFNAGSGFDNAVNDIKALSNKDIYVTGNFTTYQGTTYTRIVLLNPDGSVDSSFVENGGLNAEGEVIAISDTDEVIFGGQFTKFEGDPAAYVSKGTGITYLTNFADNSFLVGFDTNIFSIDNASAYLYGGNFGIGTGTPQYDFTLHGQMAILEGGEDPFYYTIFQGGDQTTTNITYTLPTSSTEGILYNNDQDQWSWIDPATLPSSATLQSAYENGATIVLANTEGDLVITTDETGTVSNFHINREGGGYYLRTDATNDALLLGDGGVTSVTSVLPGSNDTVSLGSATSRFSDLYLGPSTLHIGASTTAEALISYTDATQDIMGITTDSTGNADIAFFTDDLYLDKSTGYIGINTTTPAGLLSLGSLLYSTTGTASQSGTVITGTGTTFTAAMVGSLFVFADGTNAGAITKYTSATEIEVKTSQTVSGQGYSIYHSGFNIDSSYNVGINTAAPKNELDVVTDASNSGFHMGTASNVGMWLTSEYDMQFIISGGAEYIDDEWIAHTLTPNHIGTYQTGMHFYTNSLTQLGSFEPDERMSISMAEGYVGINLPEVNNVQRTGDTYLHIFHDTAPIGKNPGDPLIVLEEDQDPEDGFPADEYCELAITSSVPTWTCTSDQTLKTNIEDSEDILSRFMNVDIRQYQMIGSGKNIEYGAVAQELQEVFPDKVKMGKPGYLLVREFTSWELLKGIQEQQYEIENLDDYVRTDLASSFATEELIVENLTADTILVGGVDLGTELDGINGEMTAQSTLISNMQLEVLESQNSIVLVQDGLTTLSTTVEEYSTTQSTQITTLGNSIIQIQGDILALQEAYSALSETFTTSEASIERLGVGVVAPDDLSGKRIDTITGAYLSDSGVWTNVSDESRKENFVALNKQEVLNGILGLDISRWNYKLDEDSVTHIGPTAQDFYSAFGVGDNNTTISTLDPAGVAMVGIQALDERIKELELMNTATSELLILEENTGNVEEMEDIFIGDGEITNYINEGTYIDKLIVAGDTWMKGRIRVDGHVIFNEDTVGQAMIISGDEEVQITFTNEYQYQPIITISQVGPGRLTEYYIDEVTVGGFKIKIYPAQENDIIFNWHAFGGFHSNIFLSNETVSDVRIEENTLVIEEEVDLTPTPTPVEETTPPLEELTPTPEEEVSPAPVPEADVTPTPSPSPEIIEEELIIEEQTVVLEPTEVPTLP